MKVLLINGSPKGKASNSLKLANSFIEGLRAETEKNEEVVVDEVHVASSNIGACKGCFACWKVTPGVCCIKDDMKEVIEKQRNADVIVWSFPLYYYNVPGILKNLIDRQLPMSLPFMSDRSDGYGSGAHQARYDMSGKRHVLVSTCGFYSAEGNYDSVRQMFNHFVGKDNYITIFCGQGELFRVKELSARTGEFLGYVRKAGEEFATGDISAETNEKLHTLIYSKDIFEKMADASWGVSRDGESDKKIENGMSGTKNNENNMSGTKNNENNMSGTNNNTNNNTNNMNGANNDMNNTNETNNKMNNMDEIFTRQMAAMYDKNTWEGTDRVLEMHYKDIDKTYQILLGKDGSEVFTDGHLTATTRIDTTFDVWVKISRGELNGAEALGKGMYSISGDFSVMMNWGKIFGAH